MGRATPSLRSVPMDGPGRRTIYSRIFPTRWPGGADTARAGELARVAFVRPACPHRLRDPLMFGPRRLHREATDVPTCDLLDAAPARTTASCRRPDVHRRDHPRHDAARCGYGRDGPLRQTGERVLRIR